MIKKIGANAYGVVEYVCSKEEEVSKLPTLVGQGSTCIVIETGNVYMFNEEDLSWHSLTEIGQKVKPIEAYDLPIITSMNINPQNPILGDNITFSYRAKYDESALGEEKWTNKNSQYGVGQHTVGLQVKDRRGKWSEEKKITFTIPQPIAPQITNFSITPSNPRVGDTVTFNYETVCENERVTIDEVTFSDTKQEVYNEVGVVTVFLKVKDSRGIWSDEVSLTFNVEQVLAIPVAEENVEQD